MTKSIKIVRISTVPISLNILLKGQLAFLNAYYHIIGVSSNGPKLQEVREREGIEVMPIEMQRNISLVKDLKSLWRLYWYFKKEKPIIVHSITPKAGLLSMLASRVAGVPIRMHLYTGLIFPSKKGIMQKILILMDKLLCWAATNVYPEGEGVKRDLISYRITKKPLKVLANGNVNGIDSAYFSVSHYSIVDTKRLRGSLSVDDNDFVFVFVGRLVRDKGINELIFAFSRLCREFMASGDELDGKDIQLQYASCKLLLVGPLEQELDPLLPETLKEIENNKNIISVGWQSDVRPYFAIANALVFPSYREGFPNVVMQAGAMDLPSIVTDINGCNEIIIDNENGIIIPPKDEKSLYEAMLFFLEHDEEVKRMANNSRKMIVERYEQQVVWNALLEEYQRLEREYKKNHK